MRTSKGGGRDEKTGKILGKVEACLLKAQRDIPENIGLKEAAI